MSLLNYVYLDLPIPDGPELDVTVDGTPWLVVIVGLWAGIEPSLPNRS